MSSENCSGVQKGGILQQRVHIQQVVLDGGASHSPASFAPQLTHSHGSLHFRVLDAVGLVKNHTSPGYTQERRQLRPLGTEIQEEHVSKCALVYKGRHLFGTIFQKYGTYMDFYFW